jgi:hypothetical protein
VATIWLLELLVEVLFEDCPLSVSVIPRRGGEIKKNNYRCASDRGYLMFDLAERCLTLFSNVAKNSRRLRIAAPDISITGRRGQSSVEGTTEFVSCYC